MREVDQEFFWRGKIVQCQNPNCQKHFQIEAEDKIMPHFLDYVGTDSVKINYTPNFKLGCGHPYLLPAK